MVPTPPPLTLRPKFANEATTNLKPASEDAVDAEVVPGVVSGSAISSPLAVAPIIEIDSQIANHVTGGGQPAIEETQIAGHTFRNQTQEPKVFAHTGSDRPGDPTAADKQVI